MTFTVGDSISIVDLATLMEDNKLQILNTGLFVSAKINISEWNDRTNRVQIKIDLRENWYIYPFPIFELADRNFNVWWEEQNHSLRRVNYGIRFYHINLTGRRDLLKFVVHLGYTRKYELKYDLPALRSNQNLGITGEIFFAQNKNIGYKSVGNKLLFDDFNGKILLNRFRLGGGLTYRPGQLNYHRFALKFHQNKIDRFVIDSLNTEFFLDGKTRQKYFYFSYEYIYDFRDIKPYPMNGHYVSAKLEKEGFGIFNDLNALYVEGKLAKYFSFSKKLSLETIIKGKTAVIRSQQPYNAYQSLGYGQDFLRGYEFYVVDGLDYAYLKSSFRLELLNYMIHLGKHMPIGQFKELPLRMYLSVNSDVAYVNDSQYNEFNPLGNRWLFGGGLGLDFVLYYDKVVQIQYSINHLKEKGLFLHFKLSF